MSMIDSPMPLSDLESILAWVDTFKLSRPTKKINRDFSDAVLLAEILNVYYPKLVEMHNYPPRNSHSLKLNNWMTLNRKVLKKLKLNLCNNTMEQLSNCAPGVIERVLVMVRDKIRRDEDFNKSLREGEQNQSSGGSYYEACGEDDHILVVPVKTRVNGILEIIQKKVVSHESYLALKEQLKDAKDSADLLKQKVEHLDNLIKLKDERIEELQKQLERKQSRRRENEILQNSLSVPFDEPLSPNMNDLMPKASQKSIELIPKTSKEESRIPILIDSIKSASRPNISEVSSKENIKYDILSKESIKTDLISRNNIMNDQVSKENIKADVIPKEFMKFDEISKEYLKTGANLKENLIIELKSTEKHENNNVDKVNSNVFKEFDDMNSEGFHDTEEFIDDKIVTIENTIENEIKYICENNLPGANNIVEST